MQRMFMPTVAGCLLVCLLAGTSAGQIVLSQDFDSGSLNVAASTVTETLITLEPRRFPSSEWSGDHWWVSFKASGLLGLNPTFRIPTANAFQGYSSAHRWLYSLDDGLTWTSFQNGTVSGGYYQFSNNTAFAANDVYIAMAHPYPVSRTVAHTQSLAGNPYVFSTLSDAAYGTAGDFVIGVSNNGSLVDTSVGGKGPVPQHDLFAYMITDPNATGPKAKVVLTSGNHSGEPTGNWTQQGFIDFALSSDPAAVALREKTEIFVYPQSDPDGRWAGYFRSNPENPAKNHNRYWHHPAGFTDLTTITTAMQTDTGGSVEFFFDFHSYGSATGIGYYRRSSNVPTSIFLTQLLTLEPALQDMGAGSSVGPASVWAAAPEGLGATVSFTPETGFLANQPVDRYLTLGANYARAVLHAVENWPAPPPPPQPRSETVFLDQVQALGPVMHLRLNETYANPHGQQAADASGNGRHGTYFGAVQLGGSSPFDEGASTAAKFAGKESPSNQPQYVQVSDFNYTNAQHEFTLAFWFANADLSGTSTEYMFSHGSLSETNSLNVYLVQTEHSATASRGRLRTVFRDNNDPLVHESLDVPAPIDNQWHLYTLVYSAGEGAAIVYLDGVEVARSSTFGGDPFNPSGNLVFAGRQDLNPDRFFGRAGAGSGLLDELMLFDFALSAEEIAGLYASPVPEPPTCVLAVCGAMGLAGLIRLARNNRHFGTRPAGRLRKARR